VMTNVPGPQQPLYLAGSKLKQMMFWVPQSGNIGMGVSILSFNGEVHFGLITDAALTPDPEAIIARFAPEFERLLYLALLGTWGEAPAPDSAAEPLAPSRRKRAKRKPGAAKRLRTRA